MAGTHKRQRLSRSWCDLPSALLELVSMNLSSPDVTRFRSVCTSWRKAAERQQFRGPFLVLPKLVESLSSNEQRSLQLMRGGTKVAYNFENNNNVEKLLNGGVYVGSSHEWLFVIDKYYNFWLLNIFSSKQIQLPSEIFSHCVDFKYERMPIEKAILSARPSHDKNFKAVIIYGWQSKIWYCGGGEHNGSMSKWIPLSSDGVYIDAVWEGDKLFALRAGQTVVMFDFKKSKPRKQIVFSPSYLEKLKITHYDTIQFYLAVSNRDILLIYRFIGDRVNEDGKIIDEADLLPDGEDDNNHPLVCPYRTVEFMIFKMDVERGTWRKMESLEDDQAIVLGGNQTICLSTKDYHGIKKNSIYFSDNYWDRINEDYLYGGHDNGIFDLETGRVEMFVDSNRFDPSPFWVTIL